METSARLTGSWLLILSLLLYSCKKVEVPVLSTSGVVNITGTTAVSGGIITSEGSSPVLTRGVCWSKNPDPTIADKRTSDGAGPGTFTSNISELEPGTTYYVRAFATNSAGVGYGSVRTFNTIGSKPLSTASEATNISASSATLNGSVNANNLPTTVTFEFGTSTAYGQSIPFEGNPLSGDLFSFISTDISGLNAGTTYHFRIKAENSLGVNYSNDKSFITLGQAPAATTDSATNIMATKARLNGIVNANLISTIVTFEYGTTKDYGSSIVSSQSPVEGDTPQEVSADLTGLEPHTIYHFRVKAVNAIGTTFGNDTTFTTMNVITDADGNVYSIVPIGTQTWMQENLKTTKYKDGTAIPYVPNGPDWSSLITPGFCYLLSDPSISYGAYYNWYAASSGKLCPTGWHVPTNADWTVLDNFLGGVSSEGAKLMEIGIEHWPAPNTVATNESGFTALPAGYRDGTDGNFYGFEASEGWFTSTQYDASSGYTRYLTSDGSYQVSHISRSTGYSIRCVKD